MKREREAHYNEEFGDVRGQVFNNQLLHRCHITGMSNATFKKCNLRNSHIDIKSLTDILGVTMTLDCFTFNELRLSPEVLDALIFLLTTTAENDEKRAALRSMIDPKRLRLLERQFEVLAL